MPSVLVDANTVDWRLLDEKLPSLVKSFRVHKVTAGVPLLKAVQEVKLHVSQENYVINLCCGNDLEGGVSAHMAALLLSQNGVAYTGCRTELLARPLDVLFMMIWYAGLPMPAFTVVDTERDAATACARLRGPVRVLAASHWLSELDQLRDGATLSTQEIMELRRRHGKLVACEDVLNAAGAHPPINGGDTVGYVLVSGGKTRGALKITRASPPSTDGSASEEQLKAWAEAFSREVLDHCGTALLTFVARATCDIAQPEEKRPLNWVLGSVQLNPPLSLLCSVFADGFDGSALLEDMAVDALAGHAQRNYEVRLNDDPRKGYSLCSTRAVKKGEVIFEDECRSFAVVTRPFVEQHWDAPMKKMFTEYAWPLDSEGHLYAIWEKEPTRWRPINHSCDPTCVFAAPHSLNVIASRDLAPGEELSMDYVTFCDHTMSPFQCLCGAACCRGQIVPDEAALKKYGGSAWLRRVPPTAKPLV